MVLNIFTFVLTTVCYVVNALKHIVKMGQSRPLFGCFRLFFMTQTSLN